MQKQPIATSMTSDTDAAELSIDTDAAEIETRVRGDQA